jgi:hypothetical protein
MRLRRSDEALVRMALSHVLLRGFDRAKAKALAEQWCRAVEYLPRWQQAPRLAEQVAGLMTAGW